ncbi:hypothetical protein [Belnapia rosea]|uniref:hypothetical protein n=1 Tax=Belnapia rosea TaxID=938405 RepID=UPI000AB19EF3|nr:hypothetical protein [Belnapia rosea]
MTQTVSDTVRRTEVEIDDDRKRVGGSTSVTGTSTINTTGTTRNERTVPRRDDTR